MPPLTNVPSSSCVPHRREIVRAGASFCLLRTSRFRSFKSAIHCAFDTVQLDRVQRCEPVTILWSFPNSGRQFDTGPGSERLPAPGKVYDDPRPLGAKACLSIIEALRLDDSGAGSKHHKISGKPGLCDEVRSGSGASRNREEPVLIWVLSAGATLCSLVLQKNDKCLRGSLAHAQRDRCAPIILCARSSFRARRVRLTTASGL